MRNGDLSEQLPGNCVGQNLNMTCAQYNIPRGYPGAGTAAPGNQFQQYIEPMGKVLAGLYPSPNLVDPTNRYNYVFNTLQPANRTDLKMRFDYNISNNTKAYVRAAIEGEETENARGIWWSSSDLALPTPSVGTNKGRSVSGNVVTVLSPTMTNEILVSWSRLTLDNTWRDPSKVSLSNYPELAGYSQGFFPNASPYLPLNIITSGWGQGGPGNLWAPAMDVFAHNDALQFSNKLTKIAGSHGLKFGITVERGQKQQNFENSEFGEYQFDPWATGGTGGPVADLLTGRLANYSQGTRVPQGEWRYWNIDMFAQDSWKIRPNVTFEFGDSRRLLDQQRRVERLRRILHPGGVQPERAACSSIRAPIKQRQRLAIRRHRGRRHRAGRTTAAHLRCRAPTSRGTSTARATTSCVAASACSTTGTWATSSSRRCACRRSRTAWVSARATRRTWAAASD